MNETTGSWTIPIVVAALGAGLVGGVLFAFSAFVMRGLDRLDASASVAAMQQVNLAAPRAPLVIPLAGTALLSLALLVGGVGMVRHGNGTGWLVLAGALLYLAAFAITGGYHVPRNNALAAVDPDGPGAAAAWHSYAVAWTRLNHLRAAAALAASLAFILALTRRG